MYLQHLTSHAGLRRLVLSFGAGIVTCLLVLAGVLAANPAWHELLHDQDHQHGPCAGAHEDSPSDSSGTEAGCGVCAFALQQVGLTDLEPVAALVPGVWNWDEVSWQVATVVLRSQFVGRGRGPPRLEA